MITRRCLCTLDSFVCFFFYSYVNCEVHLNSFCLQIFNDQKPFTVSCQNMIGMYIIPLTLIQLDSYKHNDVCKNQLLKLQLAVMNKMLFAIFDCLDYSRLYCGNFVILSRL